MSKTGNAHERKLTPRARRAIKRITARVGLTAQEVCIVECLMLGAEPRTIAGKMFVTIHTVRKHTKNIYRKCNVHCTQAFYGYLIAELM